MTLNRIQSHRELSRIIVNLYEPRDFPIVQDLVIQIFDTYKND